MKLIQRVTKDIYFLTNGSNVILFMFGSVFFLGLLTAGIGLFVLPLFYLIGLFFLWIGLGILADKVIIFGFIIVGLGAYLCVILYFSEMNVDYYREQLPYTFKQADEISKSLLLPERTIWEQQINQNLSKLIYNFQQREEVTG